MIDVLCNIICHIGLAVLVLTLILACVALVGGIVNLIKIFKEDV